ncbi:hypothetical protein HK101_000521, partial [Irineochytrium annulatum]
ELGLTTEVLMHLATLKRSFADIAGVRAPNYTIFGEQGLPALALDVFSADLEEINYLNEDEIVARYDRTWDAEHVLMDLKDRPLLPEEEGFLRLFVNQSLVSQMDQTVKRRASVAGPGQCCLDQQNTRRASVRENGTGMRRASAADAPNLLFPFELAKVQKVILCFLAALRKYGGVFQQYSVDDKGQTLLAAFGLPPFAHVNNSDQCVQSMRFFVGELRDIVGAADVAISVATGELLFTAIGNECRGEAGLLASVAKKTHCLFIMDEDTHEHVKLHNVTEDLGFVEVKGRADKLHIFGLQNMEKSETVSVFGYKEERALIKAKFDEWRNAATKSVILIEAASGLGKSCLANDLIDEAGKYAIPICLSQGTEMEHRHANEKVASPPPNVYTKRVHRVLTKAGLNVEFAPLLVTIMPSLMFVDSETTMNLDASARMNLLKSAIVKIITVFVQSVSAVFIYDDSQWLDANTLEIIVLLSRFCPKMTIEVVVEKIGTTLKVDDNHQLTFVDPNVNPDDLLGDLSSAVLFQYDRLDPTFQSILKAASILGQV